MSNGRKQARWNWPVAIGTMIALTVAVENSGAESETLGDMDSERYEELEKGRSGYRETWVLPGADLQGYSKVYVWDAQFEYRDVGEPVSYRNTMSRSGRSRFGISEEDRAEFENTVSDAFMKELARGKRFEVVEDIGPDTLILRGGLLDAVTADIRRWATSSAAKLRNELDKAMK